MLGCSRLPFDTPRQSRATQDDTVKASKRNTITSALTFTERTSR